VDGHVMIAGRGSTAVADSQPPMRVSKNGGMPDLTITSTRLGGLAHALDPPRR
jgi:hypothetical protein